MKKEALKKNFSAYRSYLRWLRQACYSYWMRDDGMVILTRDRSHFQENHMEKKKAKPMDKKMEKKMPKDDGMGFKAAAKGKKDAKKPMKKGKY